MQRLAEFNLLPGCGYEILDQTRDFEPLLAHVATAFV